MLLRFLKLRIIVNGRYLYPLTTNKEVKVSLPTNPSQLVVTDGYHITKPIRLAILKNTRTFRFHINCAIGDDQLVVALVITAVLYAMGATSGLVFLQALSLAPILYILFLYYVRRRNFIRLTIAD